MAKMRMAANYEDILSKDAGSALLKMRPKPLISRDGPNRTFIAFSGAPRRVGTSSGRGSVTYCEHTGTDSEPRPQEALFGLFQQPAKRIPAFGWKSSRGWETPSSRRCPQRQTTRQ